MWRPIKLAENVESFPQNTLTQFQRASVIREAFFPTGAPNPSVTADLVLLRLDDGVGEVQVSVDGQVTRMTGRRRFGDPAELAEHQRGAQHPAGRDARRAARVATEPAFDGQWALFRLVDAARREGGPAERMVLSFSFGGKRAVFELRSPSVRNPLQLPEIERFSCPD